MELDDTQRLAKELMREFELDGWTFEFDRAKRRFGGCHWNSQTITLSAELTIRNERPHVENTIRHEIAHALAGRSAGHGRVWKAWCYKTGATPEACYDAAQTNNVPSPWLLVCPICGTETRRYRRTSTMYLCRRDRAILEWAKVV